MPKTAFKPGFSKSNLILLASIFIIILSTAIFASSFFTLKAELPPQTSQPEFKTCDEANCSADFFLTEQNNLELRLKKEDPAKVYQDVLAKYLSSAPNNQHAIVHIFGDLLYKVKGMSGITFCDGSFAFGCFHGFLVNAIAKNGIRSVKDLDQMCIQKFGEYDLGCQHGIGHGIAEYYGSNNLNQSLETCSTLSWKHQLMGCSGGVFMEYIMPTMGPDNPGSVQISPIDPENPYAPCPQVKEQYRAECYYNLGIYYYHGFNKDSKLALNTCAKINQTFYQKTCLLGLGNSIYSNLRNIPQSISECQKAPTKEAEINCRSGAAWIIYTLASTRSAAKDLCQNLQNAENLKCQADINLLDLALKK